MTGQSCFAGQNQQGWVLSSSPAFLELPRLVWECRAELHCAMGLLTTNHGMTMPCVWCGPRKVKDRCPSCPNRGTTDQLIHLPALKLAPAELWVEAAHPLPHPQARVAGGGCAGAQLPSAVLGGRGRTACEGRWSLLSKQTTQGNATSGCCGALLCLSLSSLGVRMACPPLPWFRCPRPLHCG